MALFFWFSSWWPHACRATDAPRRVHQEVQAVDLLVQGLAVHLGRPGRKMDEKMDWNGQSIDGMWE